MMRCEFNINGQCIHDTGTEKVACGTCPYSFEEGACRCAMFAPHEPNSKLSYFEKRASWEDVAAKGRAIVASDGVEVINDDAQEVEAWVMSGQLEGERNDLGGIIDITDGGPYDVILSKKSWERKTNVGGWIQGWICDCIWGNYHSGEPNGYGYSGRMCSHAYALMLYKNMRARKDFFGASVIDRENFIKDVCAGKNVGDVEDKGDYQIVRDGDKVAIRVKRSSASIKTAPCNFEDGVYGQCTESGNQVKATIFVWDKYADDEVYGYGEYGEYTVAIRYEDSEYGDGYYYEGYGVSTNSLIAAFDIACWQASFEPAQDIYEYCDFVENWLRGNIASVASRVASEPYDYSHEFNIGDTFMMYSDPYLLGGEYNGEYKVIDKKEMTYRESDGYKAKTVKYYIEDTVTGERSWISDSQLVDKAVFDTYQGDWYTPHYEYASNKQAGVYEDVKYELETFAGEFIDDYDFDEIFYDVWERVDESIDELSLDELIQIFQRHDRTASRKQANDALDEWQGVGWYSIDYSDGGQSFTNEGAIWVDSRGEFIDLMNDASEYASDTHLPYAEYLGDDDEPRTASNKQADYSDKELSLYDSGYEHIATEDKSSGMAQTMADDMNANGYDVKLVNKPGGKVNVWAKSVDNAQSPYNYYFYGPKIASNKNATRHFTYAEMQELDDEIEGRELHNSSRLRYTTGTELM